MLELYGSRGCPYTAELRADLEWRRREFREYDVEADPRAFARMVELSGGITVPVLAEDGRLLQIGWNARGCPARPAAARPR